MKRLPAMQAAIQGGPFLVENGSAVKGLNAQKSTYRTFIATDGGRRWCIGVSSSLTLKELAAWLAAPGEFPGGNGPEPGRRLFFRLLVP